MPDPDFYHQWLNLPPNPLPPDHYTLLGLELFRERTASVGRSARARFQRIKAYEDHPDPIQREGALAVMNRIALAHAVLCDPQNKRRYDQALLAEWSRGPHAGLITARLDVVSGARKVGRQVPLRGDRKLVIGKSATVSLALPGKRMNPVHGVVRFNDGIWRITAHQESLVLLNGQTVAEAALSPGDGIEIGGYRFRFRVTVAGKTVSLPAGKKVRLRLLHGADVEDPWIESLPGESVGIGGSPHALWQLNGPGVGSIHCRIDWAEQGWVVTHAAEQGTTRLNGTPVGYASLADNDRLTFGPFTAQVELNPV